MQLFQRKEEGNTAITDFYQNVPRECTAMNKDGYFAGLNAVFSMKPLILIGEKRREGKNVYLYRTSSDQRFAGPSSLYLALYSFA